jgi:hypothetical protein
MQGALIITLSQNADRRLVEGQSPCLLYDQNLLTKIFICQQKFILKQF